MMMNKRNQFARKRLKKNDIIGIERMRARKIDSCESEEDESIESEEAEERAEEKKKRPNEERMRRVIAKLRFENNIGEGFVVRRLSPIGVENSSGSVVQANPNERIVAQDLDHKNQQSRAI